MVPEIIDTSHKFGYTQCLYFEQTLWGHKRCLMMSTEITW